MVLYCLRFCRILFSPLLNFSIYKLYIIVILWRPKNVSVYSVVTSSNLFTVFYKLQKNNVAKILFFFTIWNSYWYFTVFILYTCPPIHLYNCLYISVVRYIYIVGVYNIFINVNNIEIEIPAVDENVCRENTKQFYVF